MLVVDIRQVERIIVEAVTTYDADCPQLVEYLEDLYERLGKILGQSSTEVIDLREMLFLNELKSVRDPQGEWAFITPAYARNQFAHFVKTTGISDKWPVLSDC